MPNTIPRIYKIAAKCVKDFQEKRSSVKKSVYSVRNVRYLNIKQLYALACKVLKHFDQLKFITSQVNTIESKNTLLVYVLLTELLWGKKELPDVDCQLITRILSHKHQLEKLSKTAEERIPIIQQEAFSKPKYVRINTLKISVADAIQAFKDEGLNYKKYSSKNDYCGFLSSASTLEENDFMSDLHFKELLLFHPKKAFHDHDAYINGLIILQDKASCIPPYLMKPTPGSVVLDACAAPGTKTTLFAALLKDSGVIYAIDRDKDRLNELNQFIRKSGATCVQTFHKDFLNIKKDMFSNVEYILVDPSCSGSGMLDRFKEVDSHVDHKRIEKLSGLQILLLKHAIRNFPNTKRIVYSTCSLHPQENEEVIKDILACTYNFKLLSAKELLNGPWENFGSPKYGEIGEKCLYSRPEKDLTNGFFVAVLERVKDGEINPFYIGKSVKNNLERKVKKKSDNIQRNLRKRVDKIDNRSYYNENARFIFSKNSKKKKKSIKVMIIDQKKEKQSFSELNEDDKTTSSISEDLNSSIDENNLISNEKSATNKTIKVKRKLPIEDSGENDETVKKKRKESDLNKELDKEERSESPKKEKHNKTRKKLHQETDCKITHDKSKANDSGKEKKGRKGDIAFRGLIENNIEFFNNACENINDSNIKFDQKSKKNNEHNSKEEIGDLSDNSSDEEKTDTVIDFQYNTSDQTWASCFSGQKTNSENKSSRKKVKTTPKRSKSCNSSILDEIFAVIRDQKE